MADGVSIFLIGMTNVTFCESPKDFQYGFANSGICKKSSITLASDVNIINICMIYATFGLTSVEILKKYANSRTSYAKKV